MAKGRFENEIRKSLLPLMFGVFAATLLAMAAGRSATDASPTVEAANPPGEACGALICNFTIY